MPQRVPHTPSVLPHSPVRCCCPLHCPLPAIPPPPALPRGSAPHLQPLQAPGEPCPGQQSWLQQPQTGPLPRGGVLSPSPEQAPFMRSLCCSPEVQETGPCLAKDGKAPKTSSTSHPHSWASSAPAAAWTAQDPKVLLGFCHPRTLCGTLSWSLMWAIPEQVHRTMEHLWKASLGDQSPSPPRRSCGPSSTRSLPRSSPRSPSCLLAGLVCCRSTSPQQQMLRTSLAVVGTTHPSPHHLLQRSGLGIYAGISLAAEMCPESGAERVGQPGAGAS